jgi:hypothetical protein
MLSALILIALGAIAHAPQRNDQIQITLERTTCFGECPAYRVALSGDGTVDYEGRQFVRVTGRQTWKVSPDAVAALAKEMEAAGYFGLEDRYTEHITDLPTTLTSLRIGARFKRIEDYFGAPEALHRLEKRIEEVAGVKKYVTIDGPTLRDLVVNGLSLDSPAARSLFAKAVARGDAEVVATFLSLSFRIPPIDGVPAILRARGAEVYRLLLDAGESVRARDSQNETPLHRAAGMADPDAVGVLLAAGANINARNSGGATPLMLAAESGSAETVQRLLDAGANREDRDAEGHSALDYAQSRLSVLNLFGPKDFAQIVSLLKGGGR